MFVIISSGGVGCLEEGGQRGYLGTGVRNTIRTLLNYSAATEYTPA